MVRSKGKKNNIDPVDNHETASKVDEKEFLGEKGGLSEGITIIDEDITFIPDIEALDELEELENEEYTPDEE